MNELQRRISTGQTFYVSITGLRLKRFWYFFAFFRFAIPSFRNSQGAKGNLYSAVKNINGVRHTLTAWESKKAMQQFIYNGVHLEAIKAFKKYFIGKTYGYETNSLPSWGEVHQIWNEKGIKY